MLILKTILVAVSVSLSFVGCSRNVLYQHPSLTQQLLSQEVSDNSNSQPLTTEEPSSVPLPAQLTETIVRKDFHNCENINDFLEKLSLISNDEKAAQVYFLLSARLGNKIVTANFLRRFNKVIMIKDVAEAIMFAFNAKNPTFAHDIIFQYISQNLLAILPMEASLNLSSLLLGLLESVKMLERSVLLLVDLYIHLFEISHNKRATTTLFYKIIGVGSENEKFAKLFDSQLLRYLIDHHGSEFLLHDRLLLSGENLWHACQKKNAKILNAYFKAPFNTKDVLHCLALYSAGASVNDVGYFYHLARNTPWPLGGFANELNLFTELFKSASIPFLIAILDVVLLKLKKHQAIAIYDCLNNDNPEYKEKVALIKVIAESNLNESELRNATINSMALIINSLKTKNKRKITPIDDTPLVKAIDYLYPFSLLALVDHKECLDSFFEQTTRSNEELSGENLVIFLNLFGIQMSWVKGYEVNDFTEGFFLNPQVTENLPVDKKYLYHDFRVKDNDSSFKHLLAAMSTDDYLIRYFQQTGDLSFIFERYKKAFKKENLDDFIVFEEFGIELFENDVIMFNYFDSLEILKNNDSILKHINSFNADGFWLKSDTLHYFLISIIAHNDLNFTKDAFLYLLQKAYESNNTDAINSLWTLSELFSIFDSSSLQEIILDNTDVNLETFLYFTKMKDLSFDAQSLIVITNKFATDKGKYASLEFSILIRSFMMVDPVNYHFILLILNDRENVDHLPQIIILIGLYRGLISKVELDISNKFVIYLANGLSPLVRSLSLSLNTISFYNLKDVQDFKAIIDFFTERKLNQHPRLAIEDIDKHTNLNVNDIFIFAAILAIDEKINDMNVCIDYLLEKKNRDRYDFRLITDTFLFMRNLPEAVKLISKISEAEAKKKPEYRFYMSWSSNILNFAMVKEEYNLAIDSFLTELFIQESTTRDQSLHACLREILRIMSPKMRRLQKVMLFIVDKKRAASLPVDERFINKKLQMSYKQFMEILNEICSKVESIDKFPTHVKEMCLKFTRTVLKKNN